MKMQAFKAALPHTLPIAVGFLFLGVSYGFLMRSLGFSFVYPMLMSLFIFAGSMEFVAAHLLLLPFNPWRALGLALMVNARHLFYGISMLDKYKGLGWKKPYLIFGMCDESFTINCTVKPPADVDSGWFMFFVTLLNQIYWVLGATLGGIFGSLILFDTTGLEFVMTALFVVIFLEQWLKEKKHYSSLIGLGLSLACLLVFGGSNFIIPSMITIFAVITLFRKPLEKTGASA